MARADYIRRARSGCVELFAHNRAIRTPEDNTFTMTMDMANAYKSLLRMLLTTEMSLILGPNFTLLQHPPSFPYPIWDGGEASE